MKSILILLIFILCALFYNQYDNFNNLSEYNSNFLNSKEDMGIIRKINKNRTFYAIKNEYNYGEFKNILNKIISQTNLNKYKFIKNKPEKYTWYSIDRRSNEFIPSFTKKIFKKITKIYN